MGNDTEGPRQTEATAKVAKLTWRGIDLEVPIDRDEWSVDFMESLEEGKAVGIIRGSLGTAQWRLIKSMDLKMRDLGELSDAIAVAMGFRSTGESPASSS